MSRKPNDLDFFDENGEFHSSDPSRSPVWLSVLRELADRYNVIVTEEEPGLFSFLMKDGYGA